VCGAPIPGIRDDDQTRRSARSGDAGRLWLLGRGQLGRRASDGLGPAGCGPGSPVGQVPHDTVTETVVWGDEAQARSEADTLFLHDFTDGWRVTGAGCRPRHEQVYDCAVGGR
jgi:hypothetical protein